MPRNSLICTLLAALLLAACGGEMGTPVIQPATQMPEQPTPPPTLIPTPTQTEIPIIEPVPGATFAGPIMLKDQPGRAMLNLQVSADGATISQINLSFIGLQCGDFNTGLLILQGSSSIPIEQGKFKGELSSTIGEIEGEFGSPTNAHGQVHLRFDFDLGGDPIECGTADFDIMLMPEQTGPAPGESPAAPTQPVDGVPTSPPPLLTARDLPSGDTPVVNVYSTQDKDDLFILGEVENRTPDFIHNIRLTAMIYDPGGGKVAEAEERVKISQLPPGERSPFIITIPKPDSFANFTLKVDFDPRGSAPPAELRIVDQVVELHPHGILEVYGMVENGTPDSLQYVMVVGVFYDAQGRVIGVGSNFPVGPDEILVPGKRAPFYFNPKPSNMVDYADYRLIMSNNHSITDQILPEFEIVTVEAEPGFLRGTVTFPGPGNAEVPILWVATFDDQGKLIEVAMGDIDPFPLGAGEMGAFEIKLDHEEYATYELYSEYFDG